MIPVVETYLRMVLNNALDIPEGKVQIFLILREQASGYSNFILFFDICIQGCSLR
jgi:hypothetical protein